MTYTIKFRDGSTDTAKTYKAAKDVVRSRYEDAEIGHGGDLDGGGDRTLCWRDAESSVDDDGQRAIASIYRDAEDEMAQEISEGIYVETGDRDTDGHDFGIVQDVAEGTATVRWISGVTTACLLDDLTVLSSNEYVALRQEANI